RLTFGSSSGCNSASRSTNSATAMPASASVSRTVVVSPKVGGLQGNSNHRARVHIHCVFRLVSKVGTAVFHLRNPCVFVDGTLPLFVRGALLALAIKPRKVFARGCFNARRLGQSS